MILSHSHTQHTRTQECGKLTIKKIHSTQKKNRAMYEPEPEPEPTAPVTAGETHTCEHCIFSYLKKIHTIKNCISEYWLCICITSL